MVTCARDEVYGVLLLRWGWDRPSFGAAFTWTGGGTDDAWDNQDNWSDCSQPSCYPQTTNDDATIDDECNPCTIDIVNEEIDDLTLDSVVVSLDGGGTKTTLIVDVFSAGDVTNGTKLTLTGRAILTNISP